MDLRDESFRELGNLEEFEKQIKINESLELDIIGPVFWSWKPSHETLDLLLRAKQILERYMTVTVRQVYYVLISIQMIHNRLSEYRRIVRILKRGRLAGLISFDRIVDDTREAEKTPSWKSMEEILLAANKQYRSNWWRDQPYYVDVWLEKRALRRIFYPITNFYDVYLCLGGGYQSWSEVWQTRMRYIDSMDKEWIVLYFGDLDPSGKDMPRDIRKRFKTLGLSAKVIEVALTKEDIDKYNLPRNPTKKKDSRTQWYINKYGINYAVELDALPPPILREKISSAIKEYCDFDILTKHIVEDNLQRDQWEKWIKTKGKE